MVSIFFSKNFIKTKYTLIGYKGKQVRDNIHSSDLVKCFGNFKKPTSGKTYNTIGEIQLFNLEAIKLVENYTNLKIKKIILKIMSW